MGALSESELLEWRRTLEKRKRDFLSVEKSLKDQALADLSMDRTGEISHIRLHPADLATNSWEIEKLSILSERKVKNIQEVEDALGRIDNGSYGICQDCGDLISMERLKIIPETRYCQNCEDDHEAQTEASREPKEKIELKWVSDIMRPDPITINQNESLDTALGLFSDNKIRHLPVINDYHELQGIISTRDLLGIVLRVRPGEAASKVENFWNSNKVRNFMTKYPETVAADTDLIEAGRILLDNKISCLPVVDGTKLVGILTESDFVKLVCQVGALYGDRSFGD